MKTFTEPKALESIISNRILKNGPISFAEFMDIALYHHELGYYSKSKTSGDYYTSADVHPIFAKVLAGFFYKEWQKSFRDLKVFNMIELGCGNGNLALEILKWLETHAPECYSKLIYTGVEISPTRRKSCENIIEVKEEFEFPKDSLNAIIFSNEFFDALPFHRVIINNDRLHEIFIGENFKEIYASPSAPVKDYFDWLGTEPEEGNSAEAHLESKNWMKKLGKTLKSGLVLTIDYGFEAQELFSPLKPEGTALCHYNHQASRDFYSHLGDQDITSHVNFTALMKEGENWGLKSSALRTQSDFLLENGLEDMVKEIGATESSVQRLKTSSAIKSLIHPEGMGGVFKVLIQRKND